MNVSDVLDFAVKGEIKQLAIAKIGEEDEKREENIAVLISFMNLGIIDLYTRFALATQTKQLTGVVDGADYDLFSDFIHLTYASDTDGNEIPVNNEAADFSVFTPAPYKVFIKKDDEKYVDITEIYITYIAVPPLLTTEESVVALPYQYLNCLLQYISYKSHTPGTNDQADESNIYYQRFEAACLKVERLGLNTGDNQGNSKSVDRGFV